MRSYSASKLDDVSYRSSNAVHCSAAGSSSTVGWMRVRRYSSSAAPSASTASRVSARYGPGPSPTTTMLMALPGWSRVEYRRPLPRVPAGRDQATTGVAGHGLAERGWGPAVDGFWRLSHDEA